MVFGERQNNELIGTVKVLCCQKRSKIKGLRGSKSQIYTKFTPNYQKTKIITRKIRLKQSFDVGDLKQNF